MYNEIYQHVTKSVTFNLDYLVNKKPNICCLKTDVFWPIKMKKIC